MRTIPVLVLAVLALAGCGPPAPRCINPGADWQIIVATRHDLTAEFIKRGGKYIPNLTCQSGFTDRDQRQVWIVGRPADAAVLQVYSHEILLHVAGDTETMARLTSPAWDIRYGDSPAEVTAMARALATARAAQ